MKIKYIIFLLCAIVCTNSSLATKFININFTDPATKRGLTRNFQLSIKTANIVKRDRQEDSHQIKILEKDLAVGTYVTTIPSSSLIDAARRIAPDEYEWIYGTLILEVVDPQNHQCVMTIYFTILHDLDDVVIDQWQVNHEHWVFGADEEVDLGGGLDDSFACVDIPRRSQ